jgi:hypothetical protein
MPGSRSGEVAVKAGPALSGYGQRLRTSLVKPQAASRGPENVIPVLRDWAQARDGVLIKHIGHRLLDASGAARSWLP